MWWRGQNIDNPIIDKNGNYWEFKVWHDFVEGIYLQKIYFWDKNKDTTGVIELNGGNTVHKNKLKDKMKKLANDISYRNKYLLDLKFPLEKNY